MENNDDLGKEEKRNGLNDVEHQPIDSKITTNKGTYPDSHKEISTDTEAIGVEKSKPYKRNKIKTIIKKAPASTEEIPQDENYPNRIENLKNIYDETVATAWTAFFDEMTKLKDEMKLTKDSLDNLKKETERTKMDIQNYKNETDITRKDLEKIKNELNRTSARNIEVIGLFSAIIAFVIFNVNIYAVVPNLLSALIITIFMTLSLVIYSSILHFFFHCDKTKPHCSFFLSLFAMAVLFIYIFVKSESPVFSWSLLTEKNDNISSNVLVNINGAEKRDVLKVDGLIKIQDGP